ncbi:unnamed protein product (macronuclear) [Paramecium tetraurelia]|uniref:Tyrosine-protein phosphatase domain-containing protein n=1 Tax=Paramecium tetraurelia TaxID=5888 RepID=A0E4F8_PARTE|nr:uncharacterized protein GSPATT00023349001 [Paramecium tetraurelia]CAK90175.1 unnamed protein product [Paramecium tetraurelia]|eukprot:XP_001457572.1 hypothetical protein (macronuclear) [Paramecium tetraurelia strain d4-2]
MQMLQMFQFYIYDECNRYKFQYRIIGILQYQIQDVPINVFNYQYEEVFVCNRITMQIDEILRVMDRFNSINNMERIVIVDDDIQVVLQKIKQIENLINNNKLKNLKIFYLQETVEEFLLQYPIFVFKVQNQLNIQDTILPQFPQQLIKNKILLGNSENSRSKSQLQVLVIKTMIDFNFYSNTENQQSIQDEIMYVNQPIEINGTQTLNIRTVVQTINKSPQPVMLCCQDSHSITIVVAIGYLMSIQNLHVLYASLKVFQLRGNTIVDKNFYNQLLLYNSRVLNNKRIQVKQ